MQQPQQQGEWIHLNVGGTAFATTRTTLCGGDPHSMLARMFDASQRMGSQRDASGAFLIDRDPRCFRVLLNFLRTGALPAPLPAGVTADALLAEAEFFQIDALAAELQPQNRPDFARADVIRRLYGGAGGVGQASAGVGGGGRAVAASVLAGPTMSFSRLRLTGADLNDLAFPNGTHFQRCYIRGTQFTNARLRQAFFTKAVGDSVIFTQANIVRVALPSIPSPIFLFHKASMNDLCAQTMAVFKLTHLTRSSFVRAKAANSNFCAAKLDGSDFTRANLQGALFQKASLRGCSFRDANLEHAKFQEADLRDADFTGARLDECHLTDADLRGATIDLLPKQVNPANPIRIYTKGAVHTLEQVLAIPEESRAKLELMVLNTLPTVHPFFKRIQEDLSKSVCVVYARGTQQEVLSDRFHRRLFGTLELLGIPFVCRSAFDDVLFDVALAQYSGQTFLPKVFIRGRFVEPLSERAAIRATKRELQLVLEAALASAPIPPVVPLVLAAHRGSLLERRPSAAASLTVPPTPVITVQAAAASAEPAAPPSSPPASSATAPSAAAAAASPSSKC